MLEPWIAARLRPLDAAPADTAATDYDLDPDLPRREGPLAEAAVLVALVEREAALTVLLTRRADTLRSHSGQVAFPGGRVDPGETAVEAALREAWEEIALPPERVRPAGLADPFETATGFRITPVVAFVRPPFTLSASAAEVAEVFEPPFAWLMDVANQELHEGVAPDGRVRRYYVMPWEGRRIWGATARIVRHLRERLFD
ncbi:MAG: CoA pyrophosphatase [Caulobacteraceae bacterium]|nr:CoA pyrophosphatase [Caulobacter sp.]